MTEVTPVVLEVLSRQDFLAVLAGLSNVGQRGGWHYQWTRVPTMEQLGLGPVPLGALR